MALLCTAISSSSFRKIQHGYGKYITRMSKSNYHSGSETQVLGFFLFKIRNAFLSCLTQLNLTEHTD